MFNSCQGIQPVYIALFTLVLKSIYNIGTVFGKICLTLTACLGLMMTGLDYVFLLTLF